jgi:hypothetical protein
LSRRLAFISASLSLVAVFAASASPIPLYEIYHRTSGVTKADLSLTAVSYFVAAVVGLLGQVTGTSPDSLLTHAAC